MSRISGGLNIPIIMRSMVACEITGADLYCVGF